jgi:guanylate kinase
MLTNKNPIVVSAPSGAGKSTIINSLLSYYSELGFSISSTTRPPRGTEKDGNEYYFLSEDVFLEKIRDNSFLEWAKVHGNYYGTEKKEIDRIWAQGKIPIFDVDVQGAEQLRLVLPEALYIFIIPPSLKVLHKRLTDRKTDLEETIRIRIKNARHEMKKYDLFDYIIINDDLEIAESKIRAVIEAYACRTARLKDHLELLLEDNNDNTPG